MGIGLVGWRGDWPEIPPDSCDLNSIYMVTNTVYCGTIYCTTTTNRYRGKVNIEINEVNL